MSFSLLSKSVGLSSNKRYDRQLSDLRHYGSLAEQESMVAFRLHVERQEQRDLTARIRSLDFLAKHRSVEAIRLDCTGTWLLEDMSFQLWMTEAPSSGFALYGIPGSGKMVLASNVIDFIASSLSQSENGLCYHYCDYTEVSSLQSPTIWRSLTKQLFQQLATDLEVLPDQTASLLRNITEAQNTTAQLTPLACFKEVTRRFKRVVVIVDALDELPEAERKGLLRTLVSFVEQETPKMKVFVTCRQGEVRVRHILKPFHHIELDPEILEDDMSRFVISTVNEKLQSGELALSNLNLKDVIISTLNKGAKDM